MFITRSNRPTTQRLSPGLTGRPAGRRGRGRITVAALSAVAALIPMACSANQSEAPPGEQPENSQTGSAPSSSAPAAIKLTGEGAFATPTPGAKAVTYDQSLAPVGSRIEAAMVPSGEGTKVTLSVSGLLPKRGYAVHAHAKQCGSTGKAAGPHFQHRIDPAATPDKPSSDPAYANPKNEIWMDLTTDDSGAAESSTTVPFTFTERTPASVVLHKEMITKTGRGQAGTAGDRIACLTLPAGAPGGS